MMAPTLVDAPRVVWPAQAQLGEGTVWSGRHQAVYWVDLLGHQLHRYHPATDARRSWAFDEEITAVTERAGEPGLLVTLRRGFAFFDPDSGALTRLAEPEPDRRNNRFNDGKCDAQGRFWAGTMDFDATAPTGALYRYDPDGRCTRLDDGYPVTNGPTWSADGRTMYFNGTVAGRVYAFDFDATDGSLANKRLWLQLAADDGHPDGMTTDAAGRLWIARWGAGCVTCHDPLTAAELARVPLPTRHITNCAFGGADLRTLFISSARVGLNPAQLAEQPLAGSLFAIEVGSPGVPASRFGG